ncbi:MAG: ATP-binding protein [Syntrophales bacterium]
MQNANNEQIKWHTKKRNLAVFLAGIMLIAYVSFLLVTNYLSAANLQRTLLEQLKRDTERHATAVAYFFSERKDDLVNLAVSREVSVFFENKALGMSMEYGLRLSLIPISDRFQDLIRRKKIGEDAIYSRIVLIEKGGNVLADAAAPQSPVKMRDEWNKYLTNDREDPVVHSSTDGRELTVSISYFHKGKYAGQIIAWVKPDTLYKDLLMQEGVANRMTFIVADEKSNSLPVFVQPPPFASGFPDFGKIEIGRPLEFEAKNYQGGNKKMIALRLPVQGTPFSLVVFASDPEIVGQSNPWHLVTKMALLALFVIGIVVFVIALSMKRLVLQTQLHEAMLREAELQKKRQELEAEIAERRRVETALQDTEKKLSEIIDFLPDATFAIDLNGKVIAWNRAIEVMTGIKAGDMLGKGDNEYSLPFYGDRRPILIDLALHPYPQREKEYTAIRRTGDIIFGESYTPNLPPGDVHLSATASVLRDSGGEIIAAIECIRNNTERKKLEAQLQQAQKMEAIGTLAGGIAHDFNNLLMAIQGNTSLMLMRTDAEDLRHEKLEAIENQVVAGSDLTKQLLGFARVGKYEMKPIDLNDVVEKSLIMFGRTKKEISVHKKYETSLWAVEADTSQMEQVFMNLYINAWQAMPGGGHVYLETTNLSITTNDQKSPYMKPGKYVKISLTDTGVGMDEKTKARIFEPFFTTKAMGRGTGLGLAMVYGIVKGHNGYIDVYSEKGKGTTFNIYLPASEREALKDVKTEEAIVTGKETILLVDDEEGIIGVVKEMLEALGYQVLTAASGRGAVDVYERNKSKIDLVILDMIMPEMGGGETFDRLKEINPEIKVVLASGYSINGEASGIMARGCKGFIQKPARIAELSQRVRNVLGKTV